MTSSSSYFDLSMLHLLLLMLVVVCIHIDQASSFLKVKSPSSQSRHFNRLSMSDNDLLEQMRKSLGASEDIFEGVENESRQVMAGLRDLDRDPNMKANNKFLDWLANEGVWVKQESAWGRAPHPLVISSQTEDDGETCGRGLLARESLNEGELMMTIPLDLCLTRQVAQDLFGPRIISDNMDEYIAIALLLMSEKLKGGSSRWKPYFDVLPDAGDVYPSYIWKESELDLLKGSPVYAASKSLRAKLEREYVNMLYFRGLYLCSVVVIFHYYWHTRKT